MTIRFLEENPLDDVSIRLVRGQIGLYFIYLQNTRIPYPFRPSRLVYIGMSESRQNTVGNRLRDHASGQSGNPGLTNYISRSGARFTHLAHETLQALGKNTVPEMESLFLTDFLFRHGCYPICNNQAGLELAADSRSVDVVIEWSFFD
jgi:hypothetical protein